MNNIIELGRKSIMLCYCKKCGRIIFNMLDENDKKCDCCGTLVHPIPDEYKGNGSYKIYQNDLWEKYVKTSPEFDQYLFEHRDEILAKQSAEFSEKMEHGKAILEGRDKGNQFGVECPYCHATNVKKITITSKAAHTALFGIFSVGRNSKQWHCNKCGSDF